MRAHLWKRREGHKVGSLFHQLPVSWLSYHTGVSEGRDFSPIIPGSLGVCQISMNPKGRDFYSPQASPLLWKGEVGGWKDGMGRVVATSSLLSSELYRRVQVLPSQPLYLSCHCHPLGKCSGWSPAPPSAHYQRRPRCSGVRGVRGRAW